MITLDQYISIYIPNDFNHVSADLEKIINLFTRFLTQRFGGATITEARGVWENGQPESIMVATSFASADDIAANWHEILEFAEYTKKCLNQDSLAIESDKKLYLI